MILSSRVRIQPKMEESDKSIVIVRPDLLKVIKILCVLVAVFRNYVVAPKSLIGRRLTTTKSCLLYTSDAADE